MVLFPSMDFTKGIRVYFLFDSYGGIGSKLIYNHEINIIKDLLWGERMPSYLYYLDIINIFIAVAITTIILLIAWKSYIRHRYPHELAILLMLLSFIIGEILQGCSNIFDISILSIMCFYCFFIALACTVVWLDVVTRDSVDSIKMVIVAVLGTLLIVTSLSPDAVNTHFQWTPADPLENATQGLFRSTIAVMGVFQGVLVLYYFIRIFLRAPPKIKRTSSLMLSGAFFTGILTPLVYLLGLSLIIPGIFYLFLSIGSGLIVYAFLKTPQLAFILPFQVYRIDVLETSGGLNIFSHTWDTASHITNSTNPLLYSGAYHGISHLIKEMTNKGSIKHIQMEQGVLIVSAAATQPIMCVLLVSCISRVLGKAVDTFVAKLCKSFTPDQFYNVGPSDHQIIKSIMDECFPFIPDYT